MDSANDNPLKRFSSFWLGLILFAAFGLATLVVGFGFHKPAEKGYDKVNQVRREKIREGVDKAQAGGREAAAGSFAAVGEHFRKTAPSPVEKPEFIVPDSATAKALASGDNAGIVVPEDFPVVAADAAVDPAVMEKGKLMYAICAACHGQNGEGMYHLTKTGPPLAESEWVRGPVENLIAIQFRGMWGKITVNGEEYDPVAPMVPLPQDDETVAAVLTFIRNSFGNEAGPVTPAQVKALRGEIGKPMLKPAQLLPPNSK